MIVVVSGPSGGGKTTIVARACAITNYVPSVSYTTRAPRGGEVDGVDYNFVTDERFECLLRDGKFLEHATVSGNRYATPHPTNANTILTIDPQGMKQVRSLYRDLLTIFIAPPSREELQRRLVARGKDSMEVIAGRIAEFDQFATASAVYDYVVVNDTLETAVARVVEILGHR